MRDFLRFFSACIVFFTFTTFAFSDSYRITEVLYDLSGLTRESSLKRNVKIDKNTVFESEEEFLAYLNELNQDFENTRTFETVDFSYTVSEPVDGVCDVSLNIKAKDSFHFLLVPYPKYSSSDGFSLKLKIKDTNFLGTMNTLDSSLNLAIKNSGDIESGITFTFDYPFEKRPEVKHETIWINDLSVGYSFAEMTPIWNIKSGIEWDFPMTRTMLKLQFIQGFVRDLDYIDYDDDIYLSENLKFSFPIDIIKLKHGTIVLNPYTNFNYNFDPFRYNGYSGFKKNDLKGPVISTGATFDYTNINWDGNNRNGISFSVGPSVAYNFASITEPTVYDFSLGVNAYANAYKSFENVAFNSRMWVFSYINNVGRLAGSNKVDTYLRGIIDGRTSAFNPDENQSDTPTAIVFNFDMPIRIGTTDWSKVNGIRKIPLMKYLNFEFQLSPFFDVALIKTTNKIHGYERVFNFKDGFYTAGVEVLMFPLKWRGIEVRASIGWDISTLLYGSVVETSWRNKQDADSNFLKAAEIFIGVGLHY